MVQGFIRQVRLTFQLLQDPRVPVWSKAIPVMAMLYVLSPFDFIPDFALGFGQLDDIGIVLGAMRLFEAVVPENIVAEYERKLKRE